MAWIVDPLALETILRNIFSGNIGIFTAVALFLIVGIAAFFRVSMIILIFMLGIFFIMFSSYIDTSIYFIIVSVGGLLLGYWISKIVKG